MFRHSVLHIMLFIFCVLCQGCASKPSVDPQVLAETRRDLVNSYSMDPGVPSSGYAGVRVVEALRYLEKHPALESPYCVTAIIEGPVEGDKADEGYVTVSWLENKNEATGIVLVVKENGQEHRYRLPAFKNIHRARVGPVYIGDERGVIKKVGDVPILSMQRVCPGRFEAVATGDLEPELLAKAPCSTAERPYVLKISYSTLRDLVAVGVYDGTGVDSNLVPPFVWPDFKARIAPENLGVPEFGGHLTE